MDTSFSQMQNLLHAVWPAVSRIDWAQFCNKNVSSYDDSGVPKYTGLLMHRSGAGCIGASTEQVGFLPRPEKSAALAVTKTRLIDENPDTSCSMQRRNPAENYWSGGIETSGHSGQSDAITGLPEIGDHILLAEMKLKCGTLNEDDWALMTRVDSWFMLSAREFLDMNERQFEELHGLMSTIVQEGLHSL